MYPYGSFAVDVTRVGTIRQVRLASKTLISMYNEPRKMDSAVRKSVNTILQFACFLYRASSANSVRIRNDLRNLQPSTNK